MLKFRFLLLLFLPSQGVLYLDSPGIGRLAREVFWQIGGSRDCGVGGVFGKRGAIRVSGLQPGNTFCLALTGGGAGLAAPNVAVPPSTRPVRLFASGTVPRRVKERGGKQLFCPCRARFILVIVRGVVVDSGAFLKGVV